MIASVLGNVLGLIGLAVYIVGVVALAAAVTWVVVRLTPALKNDRTVAQEHPAAEAPKAARDDRRPGRGRDPRRRARTGTGTGTGTDAVTK